MSSKSMSNKSLSESEVPYIFRILHKAILGTINKQREDLKNQGIPVIDVWLNWDDIFLNVLNDKEIDEIADMLLEGTGDTYRTAYEEAFMRNRRKLEVWLEEHDIYGNVIKARRRNSQGQTGE